MAGGGSTRVDGPSRTVVGGTPHSEPGQGEVGTLDAPAARASAFPPSEVADVLDLGSAGQGISITNERQWRMLGLSVTSSIPGADVDARRQDCQAGFQAAYGDERAAELMAALIGGQSAPPPTRADPREAAVAGLLAPSAVGEAYAGYKTASHTTTENPVRKHLKSTAKRGRIRPLDLALKLWTAAGGGTYANALKVGDTASAVVAKYEDTGDSHPKKAMAMALEDFVGQLLVAHGTEPDGLHDTMARGLAEAAGRAARGEATKQDTEAYTRDAGFTVGGHAAAEASPVVDGDPPRDAGQREAAREAARRGQMRDASAVWWHAPGTAAVRAAWEARTGKEGDEAREAMINAIANPASQDFTNSVSLAVAEQLEGVVFQVSPEEAAYEFHFSEAGATFTTRARGPASRLPAGNRVGEVSWDITVDLAVLLRADEPGNDPMSVFTVRSWVEPR